jgi:hypothetical protein
LALNKVAFSDFEDELKFQEYLKKYDFIARATKGKVMDSVVYAAHRLE